MKRYIHIAICLATILSVVGCEKSDFVELGDLSMQDRVMKFAPAIEPTKATQVEDLTEYATFSIATFLTDSDKSHYYTDLVTYDEVAGEWASDQVRYWPVYSRLDMFAYSPVSSSVTIQSSAQTAYDAYELKYSCPLDPEEQIDLVAKTLYGQSYTDSGVELVFDHILSGIKFKVEFEGESNVTLSTIDFTYIGIDRERSYNFKTQAWGESTSTYFDVNSGVNTSLTVNETVRNSSGNAKFENIKEQLMIIPQPISNSDDDPHHITIRLSYILNGEQDSSKTSVVTGYMPLPAPNSSTQQYEMGSVYTYSILVNDELLSFADVTIDDQEPPQTAYGNLNLGLLTYATGEDIGYDDPEGNGSQYYFSAAQRVKDLLLDGVRDFVVVGSMGTDEKSNGKLGYYGDTSSPFVIGTELAKEQSNEDYLFSVDLRGTYDYIQFQHADNDESGTAALSTDIDPTDPVLTPGLFKNVTSMDEVMLPQGIAAIGAHAFEGCNGLTNIDIADVRHIEAGAFQNTSSLVQVSGGELTRVHANAFQGCSSLETIELSDVNIFDECAFLQCYSLTNVDLSSADVIEHSAFNGCHNLTIKDGASIPMFQSVQGYAFSECRRLGTNGVKIDLTIATDVGDHAFNDCTEITLAKAESDDHIILSKLETVSQNAFADCAHIGRDWEVSMPVIESIARYAFYGCKLLNIIEGLERLTTIEKSAFRECELLTGYTENATQKYLSLPLVTKVDASGFYKTGLTDVRFDGNTLKTIGESAFNGCTSLRSISGLDGVTSVGHFAFSGCENLEELVLPELMDSEGSNVCGTQLFYGCKSLKKISIPKIKNNELSGEVTDEYNVVKTIASTVVGMISADFELIEEIDLPSLVVELPQWHFQEKSSLKSVNFASATSVANGVFYGCSGLTTLDLSSAESVGAYAFQNCTKLRELVLPELEDGCWGDSFFSGCSALELVSMPKLTTSGSGAIVGMITSNEIREIDLPSLVVELPQWHFQGRLSLKIANFASATSVANGVFHGCSGLTTLDLSSAESVGAYAFQDCTSLERIDLSSFPVGSTLGDGAFSNVDCSKCEIWLSDDQALMAVGTTWEGYTWSAIHSKSDGVAFWTE